MVTGWVSCWYKFFIVSSSFWSNFVTYNFAKLYEGLCKWQQLTTTIFWYPTLWDWLHALINAIELYQKLDLQQNRLDWVLFKCFSYCFSSHITGSCWAHPNTCHSNTLLYIFFPCPLIYTILGLSLVPLPDIHYHHIAFLILRSSGRFFFWTW